VGHYKVNCKYRDGVTCSNSNIKRSIFGPRYCKEQCYAETCEFIESHHNKPKSLATVKSDDIQSSMSKFKEYLIHKYYDAGVNDNLEDMQSIQFVIDFIDSEVNDIKDEHIRKMFMNDHNDNHRNIVNIDVSGLSQKEKENVVNTIINKSSGDFRIFKESAGVISTSPCWVCTCDGYLYTAKSIIELICKLNSEWKHDKHLVG